MKDFLERVINSDIFNYGITKGSFVLPPNGFFIWKKIQDYLDKKFYLLGIKNVLLPTIIPLEFIEKEKKHIGGFLPELFYVYKEGHEKKNVLRPTSEVVFYNWYKKILKTYKQLPFLHNQWVSVFRSEKNTFPFFRNSEFFWQEGHAIHEKEDQAKEINLKILKIYEDYFNNFLFLSVIVGKKSKLERFAGALETYTIECILSNGYFVQLATSHYFSDFFCKIMDVSFQDNKNEKKIPFSTSWGTSTRVIGAIADSHFDNKGIIFNHNISPYQIAIIPIIINKKNFFFHYIDKVDSFLNLRYRTKIYNFKDNFVSNAKKADEEGCPLKIFIGEKEFNNSSITISLRGSFEKKTLFFDKEVYLNIEDYFKKINCFLFEKSNYYSKEIIFTEDYSFLEKELKNNKEKNLIFIIYFCDNIECEYSISKKINYYKIRCLINETFSASNCIFCKKYTVLRAYFGKSY